MRIWLVKNKNGKYLDSNSRLVDFFAARMFRGKKTAAEKISKLESRKKFLPGDLSVIEQNIDIRLTLDFDEIVHRLNENAEDFVADTKKYKVVVRSNHGFLNANFRGYITLEERCFKELRKASIHKTFVEAFACMQIQKAFLAIPGDNIHAAWMASGGYKTLAESERKLNELLELLDGKNVKVCFIN